MATDDLPFPGADELDDAHAALIASQLHASYSATPVHDTAHVERVTRAILAQAMHAPPSDRLPMPRVGVFNTRSRLMSSCGLCRTLR